MADLTPILIKDLSEQTTATDTDYMVIGGADAKKIKWSTIVNLIRAKLGIGTAANLNTTSKEIVGAINELNTKITAKGGTLPTWYGLSWYPKRSLDTIDIVISGKTTVEMTAGSWITIGTLSGDALVPVGERFATLSTLDGIIGTMMISSGGTVSIYWAANVPAGKYIQTSVKYII